LIVTLLYSTFEEKWGDNSFSEYLRFVPSVFQNKILKFKKWQDAQASLLGKLLVNEGLQSLSCEHTLNDIIHSQFQRPYIPRSGIEFNISHSGDLVICAIGKCSNLGVDVEEVLPLEIDDYRDVFRNDEWASIQIDRGNYDRFYDYWTKKEAVGKAYGTGLMIPAQEILIQEKTAQVRGKAFYLKAVELLPRYKITVASDLPIQKVEIIQKRFT